MDCKEGRAVDAAIALADSMIQLRFGDGDAAPARDPGMPALSKMRLVQPPPLPAPEHRGGFRRFFNDECQPDSVQPQPCRP